MTIKDYAIRAEFRSKHPHTTSWLEIGYHTEAGPDRLLADLAAVGWAEDGMRGIPPRTNGRTEVVLTRRGTGLFGMWSPEERRAALADARRVLRRHRVHATSRKLTLQELL